MPRQGAYVKPKQKKMNTLTARHPFSIPRRGGGYAKAKQRMHNNQNHSIITILSVYGVCCHKTFWPERFRLAGLFKDSLSMGY